MPVPKRFWYAGSCVRGRASVHVSARARCCGYSIGLCLLIVMGGHICTRLGPASLNSSRLLQYQMPVGYISAFLFLCDIPCVTANRKGGRKLRKD